MVPWWLANFKFFHWKPNFKKSKKYFSYFKQHLKQPRTVFGRLFFFIPMYTTWTWGPNPTLKVAALQNKKPKQTIGIAVKKNVPQTLHKRSDI